MPIQRNVANVIIYFMQVTGWGSYSLKFMMKRLKKLKVENSVKN